MKEKVKEANVILARDMKSHRMFGIRVEKRRDNVWYCTWAFPITETHASNEGYGSTMISGKVKYDSKYPGCPYCGRKSWVECGKCGKLTCYDDCFYTCAWCGNSGMVIVREEFDLQGGGY